jgi:colanic acid/amylovoran biosynthesis glycosyltransferase
VQTTASEHFWKWFMVRFAGGRNVMLATGGGAELPSSANPNLRWVFSSSLTERELKTAGHRNKRRDSSVRLIIVCRQEEKKGTEIVIESLPIIAKAFPLVTLDVVGDGSALLRHKDLARKLEINERVTFHGKVNHDEVVRLLRQADLFCYPTTASEGFPKVVLEALAQGLPVVTTKVSVLPKLIGETGSGMLIDEAAPAAMADAVTAILTDMTRYSAMSEQAVKTASEYSLERWRDTIGVLLQAAWGKPLRSDV